MYLLKVFNKDTLEKIYEKEYVSENISLFDNNFSTSNSLLYHFIIRQMYPFINNMEELYSNIKGQCIFEIRDSANILYRFKGSISSHKIISQAKETYEVIEIEIHEYIYSIKRYKEDLLSGQQ